MGLHEPAWIDDRPAKDISRLTLALSAAAHAALLSIVLDERGGQLPRAAPVAGVAVTLTTSTGQSVGGSSSEGVQAEPAAESVQPVLTDRPTEAPVVASTAVSDRKASRHAARSDALAEASDSTDEALIAAADPADAWRDVVDFGDVPLPMFPPPILSFGEPVVLVMRLYVSARGRVERVEILRSSGFPSLDDAAIEAGLMRSYPGSESLAIDRKVVFYTGEDG